MGATTYVFAPIYVPNPSLLIYGGAGPDGSVLGNATDPGGDWWIYNTTGATSGWKQYQAPPGYTSYSTGYFLPTPGAPVPPRYDGGLVGYPGGSLLFGGSSPAGSSLGDSWFSNSGTTPVSGLLWPPPQPAPAYGASMTGDPADRSDLLFGGCGSTCGNASTWSFAGTRVPNLWVSANLTAQNSPPARMNASLTNYTTTTNQFVLLFGGLTRGGTLLNDLWTYSAGVWANVTSAETGTIPSPRQSAGFTYDVADAYAVLFGGCGAVCPLNDNYSLTLSPPTGKWNWAPLGVTTGPPARYGAAMTWDDRDGAIVLYGGCGVACPLSDTWSYVKATGWTKCSTTSCTTGAPPARWGASISYDAVDKEIILFGGCGSTCPLSDTWGFAAGNWYQITPTSSPPARYDAAMAYDFEGKYVIMFGGIGLSSRVLGEYGWAFYAGDWYSSSILNQLPRAPDPVARFGASLAANSAGTSVLLVGGCQDTLIGPCGPLAGLSTTWEFTNGSWKEICGSCGPSARWDAGLTYDAADTYFVLFGGCRATGVVCSLGSLLSDTWTFGSGSWTSQPITGPSARADMGMSFDAKDGVVVLYGGYGCSTACGDTWTFHAGTWSLFAGSTAPTSRFGPAMTYDGRAADRYVILFGGQGPTGTVLSDTWKFTTGTGWVRLFPTGSPTNRFDAAMTYDATDDVVILFGGASIGGAPLGDTWQFATGTWSLAAGPNLISATWGASMTFVECGPAGAVILFGGAVSTSYYSTSTPAPGATSPGQGGTWLYLNTPVPEGNAYWIEVSRYA